MELYAAFVGKEEFVLDKRHALNYCYEVMKTDAENLKDLVNFQSHCGWKLLFVATDPETANILKQNFYN